MMWNLDESTIAAQIEANINAYLLSFARLPGAVLHDDAESTWVDSGIADETFNSVVRARFSPEGVDAGIESILSHFRRRHAPVTWHVGPGTEPADLSRFLLAHGLTHSEDEPGMAVDLGQVRNSTPPPSELRIETVRDERGLADWVGVWLFPVPDDIRRVMLMALLRRGVGDDLPWRYYLGRVEGQPVATSELFISEGVAAVHYVVTLPELRRRGIGAAMTLQVLREARALSCRMAVLTSSPDGLGIYRRLGFRAYCTFRRYTWEPNQRDAGATSDAFSPSARIRG